MKLPQPTTATGLLADALLEACAVVVGLVAAAAVHHNNHLAVVANVLATIRAGMVCRAAALIAGRNVGFRFLLSHGVFAPVLQKVFRQINRAWHTKAAAHLPTTCYSIPQLYIFRQC